MVFKCIITFLFPKEIRFSDSKMTGKNFDLIFRKRWRSKPLSAGIEMFKPKLLRSGDDAAFENVPSLLWKMQSQLLWDEFAETSKNGFWKNRTSQSCACLSWSTHLISNCDLCCRLLASTMREHWQLLLRALLFGKTKLIPSFWNYFSKTNKNNNSHWQKGNNYESRRRIDRNKQVH